jgi:hypothetical protein
VKVPPSDRRTLAVRLFVATRLGAGLVALLVPRAVLAALRSGTSTSEVPTRLFGGREIGYGVLLSLTHGGARRAVLGVGIATDSPTPTSGPLNYAARRLRCRTS